MAPSTTSPKTMAKGRKIMRALEKSSKEQEALGSNSGPTSTAIAKSDIELVNALKGDLQSIRGLVTCTICDQLLYEPWTLICGHTYCYSCLCSWFLPNKRKKTCPDCRSVVRQMPAPAFLVKQLVEIFVNRAELMPVDETIEQHKERRKEEGDIVEADRATEAGLFKGCFLNRQPVEHLRFNEENQIIECTECGAEYISGTMCEHCGIDFEGDEEQFNTFSDIDGIGSIEGYDVEFEGDIDLEELDEDDEDDFEEHEDMVVRPSLWLPTSTFHGQIRSALNASMGRRRRSGSHSSSEVSGEESMDSFNDDDETRFEQRDTTNSPDGSASHASASSRRPEGIRNDGDVEDSDDEGGAVSNGRRRSRPAWAVPRVAQSAMTVTDESVVSEPDDYVARHLQDGWSPLDQEQDSDYGEQQPFIAHDGNDDSDTDTMVGNQVSDEEDDGRQSENGAETPRWEQSPTRNPYIHQALRSQSVQTATSDGFGNAYDSDAQGASVVDLEGDVEMSVASGGSRRGSSASINSERRQRRSVEILGSATAIQEVEEDSSDTSVQPAVRRRRRPSRPSQTPEYDPRISMMFAQHQSDLRDVTARQSPYFEDRAHASRVEPASRSRMSSYRLLPQRRTVTNNSHTPSGTILTPASNRPSRVQRQYSRRYVA